MSPLVARWTRCRGLVRDDRGDTLIEILIAVVIISFAAVAILGALTSVISASTEHRNLASDDTLAKSALEAAKYQLQLQASPQFLECGSSSATGATVPFSAYTTSGGPQYVDLSSVNGSAPTGYSVVITGVQCWHQALLGDANSVGNLDSSCQVSRSGNTLGGCSANDVSGLQLITVTATDPAGVKVDLSTIVRNPAYVASYKKSLSW
jgi:type II secretory pathway pseudopilin PulG